MAPLEHFPRHTLVWLRRGASCLELDVVPRKRLEAWFAADLPAVVARRQGNEPPGYLRLGIALSPAEDKRRLSIAISPNLVARSRPPLALHEVIHCAPHRWDRAMERLSSVVAEIGLEPCVYGSFAWQALTEECYVTPKSDLDLIWRPRSFPQLNALFSALPKWEMTSGRRADGEIVLPSGDAVCWRELASKAPRILVKSHSSVELRSRAELLAEYARLIAA